MVNFLVRVDELKLGRHPGTFSKHRSLMTEQIADILASVGLECEIRFLGSKDTFDFDKFKHTTLAVKTPPPNAALVVERVENPDW